MNDWNVKSARLLKFEQLGGMESPLWEGSIAAQAAKHGWWDQVEEDLNTRAKHLRKVRDYLAPHESGAITHLERVYLKILTQAGF